MRAFEFILTLALTFALLVGLYLLLNWLILKHWSK